MSDQKGLSLPPLASQHHCDEAFEQITDFPDAPNDAQIPAGGENPHQQIIINPLHQGPTPPYTMSSHLAPPSSSSPQSLHQHALLTQSSPSILATQTGIPYNSEFIHRHQCAVCQVICAVLTVHVGVGVMNLRSKSAVLYESVSVSTTISRDASTQTAVHAETQTERSTVSACRLLFLTSEQYMSISCSCLSWQFGSKGELKEIQRHILDQSSHQESNQIP